MTNFRTYFDLSEDERAALSEADVSALCKVELMQAGVLDPQLPTPTPVAAPRVPTATFFAVELKTAGRYGTASERIDVAFADPEIAQRVADSICAGIERDYGLPDDQREWAKPILGASVVSVPLMDANDVARLRTQLAAAKAAKDAHDKAREENAKLAEKARAVTDPIWKDWWEQLEAANKMRKVRDTFEEYVRMTGGDRDVARKFLAKTFSDDLVRRALGEQAP